MEDIRQQGVTKIYCLGDIIGYGPNPCECLDQVMQLCAVTILGNHDQAALFDPDGFNPVALQAVYWTREQLERRDSNAQLADERWDFLGELPRSLQRRGVPVRARFAARADQRIRVPGRCLQPTEDGCAVRPDRAVLFPGPHAHSRRVHGSGEFITPDECNYEYRLTGDKAMFNVGSVGQPRDGDPRSCYVIVHVDDEPRVEFRRVEYPLEMTIQKIYKIPSLDNMLGDRLRSGR